MWETLAATTGGRGVQWANSFMIPNGARCFLPHEKGDLIIAKMSPKGYKEMSRTMPFEPTHSAGGRDVVWSHPAFADRCVFARNDRGIMCVSPTKE